MQNLSRVSRQNRKGFVLLSLLSLFLLLLPSNKPLNAIQIDINTAPLEDLVKIIHIGEKRVLELISLRPFSSLDDLIRIKGIGEARVQDIKKQGLAWVTGSQLIQKPIIETQTQEPINYSSGIIINEILPSPEGPDNLEEWIELKNINDKEIDLSEWKIQDTIGSITTYTFSQRTKIEPKGFLVLSRPTTKITLNNSGDGLNLIQPDGKIIDRVDFEKAPLAESYNLTETGWLWSIVLTPGAANIISASLLAKETEPTEEPKETGFQKEVEENLSKKELAAISEQVAEPLNFLNILFPALILACVSGIIILMFKKRLRIDFQNKSE